MKRSDSSPVIIALDGPAGAGKSTLAQQLARRLGYVHLNSGALYRAVALLGLRNRVSPEDGPRLAELARQARMEFTSTGRLLVNGEDVTEAIRAPQVDAVVSRVAVHPPVREAVTEHQRRIAGRGNVVVEGRDIGTVVFPEAQIKFYVDASVEERARRRYLQLRQEQGTVPPLEEIERQIRERDRADSTRETSPLRVADDAILVDTTGRTVEQVVEEMVQIVRKRLYAS
ncbi:MAG: cytidylate kinase [Candidatus Poribacteria bacterium]|nr:MAG: cytidylate kinase [Candidatus Poribacteria bacterium]